MDHSGEARFVSTIESSLKIRIPSRVMDPRTKVPGEARHLVNWKFRLALLPLKQGFAQFTAQLFIGIQQKNPVVLRTRGRAVFMIGVVGKRPLKEEDALGTCDFHRAVRAP